MADPHRTLRPPSSRCGGRATHGWPAHLKANTSWLKALRGIGPVVSYKLDALIRLVSEEYRPPMTAVQQRDWAPEPQQVPHALRAAEQQDGAGGFGAVQPDEQKRAELTIANPAELLGLKLTA